MVFRKAALSELEQIFAMFGRAAADLKKRGIDQWDKHYPNREILREDIHKGEMFVGVDADGEILSAFVLNQDADEDYQNGDWQYPAVQYWVAHRLCVDPRCQGSGIGRETMLQMEKLAEEYGAQTVRLDVFSQNLRAFHLYEKLGYQTVGSVVWRKGKFFLMEKRLRRADINKIKRVVVEIPRLCYTENN